MTKDGRIGLGLIGCGAFGEFCLTVFSGMEQVRIAAVADVYRQTADSLAEKFGAGAHYSPAELVARDDVDLVHIATPPASHYEIVMLALRAGKNCLCEKPLAIDTDQADQMLALASEKGLVVPVNFVLRHNAVTEAVKAVIDSGVLGRVLSARLTNCAGDTPLGADHWFWDKSVSGEIFIEHGVHFFDLYSYWLGAGKVISAHVETRDPTGQEDRVTCQVRHDNGAIASHYHGFDQLALMDRTDHRLVCEMGDIRVNGWIPLSLSIEATVDEQGLAKLTEALPGCEVEVVERYSADRGKTTGRGRPRNVSQRVIISLTPQPDKQKVYADSVASLLADQVAFILDHGHCRRVTEANGLAALALACRAAELAC